MQNCQKIYEREWIEYGAALNVPTTSTINKLKGVKSKIEKLNRVLEHSNFENLRKPEKRKGKEKKRKDILWAQTAE